MSEQLELFYPRRAGFTEGSTSRDAAIGIEQEGRARKLRALVLSWYCHNTGTADECAAALKEAVLSIRPRVSELRKQGLLAKTGQRRRTTGGRDGHVWKLVIDA